MYGESTYLLTYRAVRLAERVEQPRVVKGELAQVTVAVGGGEVAGGEVHLEQHLGLEVGPRLGLGLGVGVGEGLGFWLGSGFGSGRGLGRGSGPS